MPISEKMYREIKRLNADYTALTGKVVKKFVCPITLEDDPSADLCNGHILNQGIKSASRQTIVQRKDIDNYFGHTLEPDLIKFLNIAEFTPGELARQSQDMTITLPSGSKASAFFAGPKARRKFQQVDLLDTEGNTVASPFLRVETSEIGRHSDVEVTWTVVVSNSAMTGALIKSAYSALFKLLGYRYVLDVAGDRVRQALAMFYQRRVTTEQAFEHFREFTGCTMVALSQDIQNRQDTLESGTLMLHYTDGKFNERILFAVTCLFRVNDKIVMVTLPCNYDGGNFLMAHEYYRALLRNRNMPQDVYWAQFKDGKLTRDRTPMTLEYTQKLP